MQRRMRIAVIGAGLGGMTVAGLLQRAGFPVRVYEQAQAFSRIGAGIHLSANVMLVMRRLGIETALSNIGLHPDAFVSRQWDTGETLFELPLDAIGEARYGAAYINVHRGDLHRILETSLRPGSIAFGCKLSELDTHAGAVRLAFENGRHEEADLVIGADGLNSKVREYLFGPEKPRFSGHIAHRAVFPAGLLNGLAIRACTKWWGQGNHILVYYMTQAREDVYLVSSVPEANWDSDASFVPCDRDAFQAAFKGYHPELRQIVAAAPEVTKWPVFDREPVDHWSRGPVVLLGDACHPLLPYMAAGAAMAIEDGAVLARCIDAFGSDHPAEAFAVYAASRMPRVEMVRRISLANTWLRTPVDPDWLFGYDACTVDLSVPRSDAMAQPR
jgi:6-hydroxynicotinate 3-monooxygenase